MTILFIITFTVLGIILLVLEFAVIPVFTIAGVGGIELLGYSVYLVYVHYGTWAEILEAPFLAGRHVENAVHYPVSAVAKDGGLLICKAWFAARPTNKWQVVQGKRLFLHALARISEPFTNGSCAGR